jgi:poly(3-hydroxybutyrate) depolymerase
MKACHASAMLERLAPLTLAIAAACGGRSDATRDARPVGARCTGDDAHLSCASQSMSLDGRTVTYQLPEGDPPAAGWPVVVFYQGSFIPGSHAFAAASSDAFGQYQLTATVKALLDRGYAVIAPNAQGDGTLYWQTNIPPYATNWTGCDDDMFVHHLLDAMASSVFGPLDGSRRFAMGLSSGGFMTSRMAVSYGGTFRALAIASASYATCSTTCSLPAQLPADHPPTLFLHGSADTIVPAATMTPYHDELAAAGRPTQAILDPSAGHEWLAQGVTAIPAWFEAH